jgi:hypothetical protein
VDGTGSGSCPVAGCGISGVEPSGSASRELVKLNYDNINYGTAPDIVIEIDMKVINLFQLL